MSFHVVSQLLTWPLCLPWYSRQHTVMSILSVSRLIERPLYPSWDSLVHVVGCIISVSWMLGWPMCPSWDIRLKILVLFHPVSRLPEWTLCLPWSPRLELERTLHQPSPKATKGPRRNSFNHFKWCPDRNQSAWWAITMSNMSRSIKWSMGFQSVDHRTFTLMHGGL